MIQKGIYLNIKCRVETHLEVTLLILDEESKETLLEDGRGKGIGQDYDTVCGVGKRLHLEQTDLI